jgi:YbbR domain-containing protein
MIPLLRSFVKFLPSLLLAFVLALAVWISAVTASDPIIDQRYTRSITIEIVGQDPGLVITTNIPTQVTVKLSAPQSIWNTLINEQSPVRATIDLSGLGSGTHTVPVDIRVSLRPVQITDQSPTTISVALEPMASKTLPIRIVPLGEPAIGFQADAPTLSQGTATVSGAQSLVNRVQNVRVVLDLSQIRENVSRSLTLEAVDANDQVVSGVTVSPEQITVTQSVTNRGGYRNVVVKVATTGQIASGYRLTNISVFPPAITVFSTNPQIVDNLPGYVETASLDLTGAKNDLDVRLPLDLLPGVSVVGDQTVSVQVGIAAIESSLTLSAMQVEVIGLAPGQKAKISPETVDVILSGPLPLLDGLKKDDVRVVVEMNGEDAGTYQRIPRVELKITELRVESILPGTVEVTISGAPNPSPTSHP